jgi:hypothetical protein
MPMLTSEDSRVEVGKELRAKLELDREGKTELVAKKTKKDFFLFSPSPSVISYPSCLFKFPFPERTPVSSSTEGDHKNLPKNQFLRFFAASVFSTQSLLSSSHLFIS